MRTNRTSNGGTLALTVACTVLIVMIGIALFFVMRIMGGHRELDHSARSGNLNVAKQAIQRPFVRLTVNTPMWRNFRGLTDRVDGQDVVNLKVYNRLVGQALLVALNAAADGNQQGKNNANNVIAQLQGAGGVGDQLRGQLGARNNTNPFFQMLGFANSTRMLGANGQETAQIYQTAFAEARNQDIGATNLLIPVQAQLPVTAAGSRYDLPNTNAAGNVSYKRQIQVNGGASKTYVRGYQDLVVGNGINPIIGVPTQPGSQPHLLSTAEFSSGLNRFTGGGQRVPPNAFEFGSQQTEGGQAATQNGRRNAIAFSRALVGVLNAEYKPSIPLGYVAINNTGGTPVGGNGFRQGQGVLQNQLRGDGIVIDRSTRIMSANNELMRSWARHNELSRRGPGATEGNSNFGRYEGTGDNRQWVQTCPNCQFASNNTGPLRKPDGSFVNGSEAHGITGNLLECTDQETGGTLNGPPHECESYLTDFENAYDGPLVPGDNTRRGDVMGVESYKASLINQFPGSGPATLPATSPVTGLRVINGNDPTQNRPWNAGNGPLGNISSVGTINQLFNIVEPGGNTLRNFIHQRMREVKPEATDAEINAALTTRIDLGETVFIYMDPNTGRITAGRNRPHQNIRVTADGTPRTITAFPNGRQAAFSGGPGWVNAKHENGIHEQMFLCQGGTVTTFERAILTPSSGSENFLGDISFQQFATSNNARFSCRD